MADETETPNNVVPFPGKQNTTGSADIGPYSIKGPEQYERMETSARLLASRALGAAKRALSPEPLNLDRLSPEEQRRIRDLGKREERGW